MAQTLALPLRVHDGRSVTMEQGSGPEVAQSVGLLLATRPGERRSVPTYGLPDPLFVHGLDVSDVTTTVLQWEPRADNLAISTATAGATITASVSTTPTTGAA